VPDADSGDSYYWNVVTGETRWDRPDQSTILPPAALPRTGSSDSSSADTHTGADTNAAEEGGSAMPISSSEPDASASNAAAAAGALAAFDYGSDSDDDTAQEDSAQHATLATTASAPHAPPLSEEDRALAALEAIAHIDDMNQLDQADTSEKHQVGVSIEQQSERPSALSTQASEKGVASGGGVWSGKASSGADEARKAHLRMLADKFNGKTHSAAVSQPAVPQEMQSSAVLPQVPQEVPQHIAEVPAQVKDDVEDLTAEAGGQEAVANANTPLPTESLEMDGQEDAESVVGVMSESVMGAMSGHRPAIAFAMPKAKPCAKMHLASGKQALNSLRPAKDSDVDDFLAHLEDDDTQSAPVPKAIEARKPNGAPSPHAHTTTVCCNLKVDFPEGTRWRRVPSCCSSLGLFWRSTGFRFFFLGPFSISIFLFSDFLFSFPLFVFPRRLEALTLLRVIFVVPSIVVVLFFTDLRNRTDQDFLANMFPKNCRYPTGSGSTNVHIFLHMYVYIHVCTYVYTCLYTKKCVNMYVYIYICIYAFM